MNLEACVDRCWLAIPSARQKSMGQENEGLIRNVIRAFLRSRPEGEGGRGGPRVADGLLRYCEAIIARRRVLRFGRSLPEPIRASIERSVPGAGARAIEDGDVRVLGFGTTNDDRAFCAEVENTMDGSRHRISAPLFDGQDIRALAEAYSILLRWRARRRGR